MIKLARVTIEASTNMVFKVVPKRSKPCLWITGGCGALIFALSFVCIFVAFPALIEWQVDVNYDLWNKDSIGYKNFVRSNIIYILWSIVCG